MNGKNEKFISLSLIAIVLILAVIAGIGGTYALEKNSAIKNLVDKKTEQVTPQTPGKTKVPVESVTPEFGPYMKNMQRSIKANWNPPKSDSSKQVILMYKIGKDGKLLNYSVYKSSGDKKSITLQ